MAEEENENLRNAWEAGGPNDPTVAFKALNEQLHTVKEELSPFGWRAYVAEFNERQTAERRLQAMAAMPGSGSEPKDGVIKGTPLWQERLDHLLLVEHLKKKIMVAHCKFNDACELFLKSHGWLVQDYNFSDLFIKHITTVPESAHDRIDYLQAQLEQSRREAINIRHEFEDYKETQRRNREEWCKRKWDHDLKKNFRLLSDDVTLSWAYAAQRGQLTSLRNRNDSLQERCMNLELEHAEQTDFLAESQRRWIDDKTKLIKERDEFKKKWQKMVKANEQAMADLKRTEGTAEGQRTMIILLNQEKAALETQVEELEEQRRVMAKQLADLRDELAKIRGEVRRVQAQMKETEAVLVDVRMEAERVERDNAKLEAKLDDAAIMEATLRDEVIKWKTLHEEALERERGLREDLANEQQRCRDLEAYRDQLLQDIEDLKAEIQKTIQACKDEVHRIKVKCKKQMDEFRTGELAKVKDEFQEKTDVIVRRNDLLEKEMKVGETLGPHLATLNPLTCDDSRVCPVCRRVIVYEGAIRG